MAPLMTPSDAGCFRLPRRPATLSDDDPNRLQRTRCLAWTEPWQNLRWMTQNNIVVKNMMMIIIRMFALIFPMLPTLPLDLNTKHWNNYSLWFWFWCCRRWKICGKIKEIVISFYKVATGDSQIGVLGGSRRKRNGVGEKNLNAAEKYLRRCFWQIFHFIGFLKGERHQFDFCPMFVFCCCF